MSRITLAVASLVLLCSAVPGVAFGTAGSGSSTISMLEVERRLSSLGYWITRADGRPDASTHHAIMAFQKVERRKRTGRMSAADLAVLRSAKTPEARYPEDKTAHVEVDLTRQVLFFVNEAGTVTRILPISSGNEKKFKDKGEWKVAHTPRGLHPVGAKINGIRKSSLGLLYYPNYFVGGLAIHGSNSIPPYPASHGCVRIPRFSEQAVFKMIKLQMNVYLYD